MNDDIFATSDVALTAFLKLCGYSLTGVDKTGAGKIKFMFASTPSLQQAQLNYYNNSDDSRVVAKQFYEELTGVKTLLFNTM